MFQPLYKLSSAALKELGGMLGSMESITSLSTHAIKELVGAQFVAEVTACLHSAGASGWSPGQLSQLIQTILDSRSEQDDIEQLFDLVLSGPEVQNVPTRSTLAVMEDLLANCEDEVTLVGYAIHNGKHIFQQLSKRMAEVPDLDVWFCLNIIRSHNDTSLASQVVRRFEQEFRAQHWPWEPVPQVYYYPDALTLEGHKRASLHAKCVIVDRKTALITSANFTEAALERNIEAGVIINYQPFVTRLATYFDQLKHTALKQCHFK